MRPSGWICRTGPQFTCYLGKDGGVYLIDAKHMGKMYHRVQIYRIVRYALAEPCHLDWAGTISTQPTATTIDGVPSGPHSHIYAEPGTAGRSGGIEDTCWQRRSLLRTVLESPGFFDRGIQKADLCTTPRVWFFRATVDNEYAWVAEGKTLLGIRVRDGEIVERQDLLAEVAHDVLPIIKNNVLYEAERASIFEAYEIK